MQWFGRSNSVAIGLIAVACVSAGLVTAASGKLGLGIALIAGGLAILLPLLIGRGLGSWDDAMLLFNLVRDPGDTIYDQADAAYDRHLARNDRDKARDVAPGVDGPSAPPADTFDADAAFARYMANRGAPSDNRPTDQSPMPPVRGFGRKGV